jgi:hypothetical protein
MNNMRKTKPGRCIKIWRFLSSADALYHWIGLGSLAVLLIKVLVLNGIAAPLRFMSAVSPVVESVLGSVIASYIFYMFCIHPPVFAEKKTSAVFVNFILTRIKKSFEDHMRGISPTLSYDSAADDFYKAFTGIAPFTNTAPLLIQVSPQMIYADWFGYFHNENTRINEEITRLMDSRLNLNTEMTFILNLINDSSWFMAVKSMTNMKNQMSPSQNPNPFVNSSQPETSLCKSMYDLKELIRSLQPAIDATGKLAERF